MLDDEDALVKALQSGDERAFAELIDAHSGSLTRLATVYVRSPAVAEEVVQETWLGVIRGIGRFERRSSLSTWIFRILTRTAARRAERERRSLPFSSLDAGGDDAGPEPERFFPADHPRYAGHWALGPTPWETPEEGLLAGETREIILGAIEALPASQRAVITLRDIEGWPPDEVSQVLGVSEAYQRVLLHRGRERVRGALERYHGSVEPTV